MVPTSLTSAASLRARGELTAVDLAIRCLANARAAAWTNAFVELAPEADILASAAAADERRSRGASLGPLDGIPIGVKDNISVRGLRCTAGSQSLRDYVAPFNATAVERLLAAGAVVVGE